VSSKRVKKASQSACVPLAPRGKRMKRAAPPAAKTSGVYVLQLKNRAKFYVGWSDNNVDDRVKAHRNGYGSAWCKLYGVHEQVPALDGRSEQDETLICMLTYGFENVRGWEFVGCAPLSVAELDTVRRCSRLCALPRLKL